MEMFFVRSTVIFFPRATYHLTWKRGTFFFFFPFLIEKIIFWKNEITAVSNLGRQQRNASSFSSWTQTKTHNLQTRASNWSYLGDRGWIKGHYAGMRSAIALNLPGVQVWVSPWPQPRQECRSPCAPAPASASCSPCRHRLHFTRITSSFINNEVQIVLSLNTTLTLKELEIQYPVPRAWIPDQSLRTLYEQ